MYDPNFTVTIVLFYFNDDEARRFFISKNVVYCFLIISFR